MSKIYLNGTEYASVDTIVEVDQETYDFLTEAEKCNGQIYAITDGIPNEVDASGIHYGDGTVEGALDALNSKFTVKEYSITTGNATYGSGYYGDKNISDDITQYGKVVSAIPLSSTSNAGYVAYVCNNTTLRVLSFSQYCACSIRVIYMK